MSGRNAAVLVVDADPRRSAQIKHCLEQDGFSVLCADTNMAVLQAIHANPPACAILQYEVGRGSFNGLLQDLKGDNIYGHLPIILLTAPELLPHIDWMDCPADDYVTIPVDDRELCTRVKLSLARTQRDIYANPLTGLPGNIPIMREAERRLSMGEPFAMAYIDVDNFKAFNDKYGFSRGDEVLRMTARILLNAVRHAGGPSAFAGHVGGDDFVFIVKPDRVEATAQLVCDNFDLLAPDFYDADDRARGCIESKDRAGNPRTFPLMSCSIAVIDTSVSLITHVADMVSRAAEIKKLAKSFEGSNYVVDRRH